MYAPCGFHHLHSAVEFVGVSIPRVALFSPVGVKSDLTTRF